MLIFFDDKSLQSLWNKGVEKDKSSFYQLYKTLWNDEKNFPSELDIKISWSECELDLRGALCFRKRIWIPNYEPLQTAIIQKSHDSHITGHLGRNSTVAIISRDFYWSGFSKMVRQFCRNCDVCGRSNVWRSRK